MSLLEVSDVVVEYHHRGREPVRAVAGVSLEVEAGQIVGLVGESGCGKSTLARAIVGLTPIAAGAVRYDGRDVGLLRRRARPKHQLGLQMVFQNPYSSLNPRRTIGSQLEDGLRSRGVSDPGARRARTSELLERVGLAVSAMSRYPHQFSGGQRQRIAIARALAVSPSVIVLDEPLASLDASAQAQVANLLTELTRTMNLGLLLISHDLGIVRYVADVTQVMYLGEIVEAGTTEMVWSSPRHPYTAALIGAVPRADGEGVLPSSLPGEVPDPARPPSGCRFHPRCPHAFDRCSAEHPPTFVAFGRRSACWLNADEEQAGESSSITRST